jgi:hypothetical protein
MERATRIAPRRPWALALLLVGCEDLDAPEPFGQLDRPYFDCQVQPVLTKLCSGFACHGDPARYYTLFTRNRLRYGGTEEERGSTTRPIERDYNFTSSLGYVDFADPDQSLLLTKPLDEAAGGAFHRGAEIFGGGDVFTSRDDREFKKLAEWVHGASDEPDCVEPGSDL